MGLVFEDPSPTSLPERLATVDLSAVRHNIRHVVALTSPAAVMAVVKANGYGHGAAQVATAALEAGATWVGTAHVSEALALRAAGVEAPLLCWLHTEATDFRAAIDAGIDLGVSGWELEPIAQAAASAQTRARVHLKIDTGLGRNGSTQEQWPALVRRAAQLETDGVVRVVGIFSHLSVADEPERAETDEQIAAFRAAVEQAQAAGLKGQLRHLANSPALLSRPDSHFDLVRCGLVTYGLSPFEGTPSAELNLRPAMGLSTRVANAKRVPAGQGVSYGLRYSTDRETVLGLIPLGYADGVPRISEGGPVLINGSVYPSVGRVAMDQFVVDLGPDADENQVVGALAVLFGADGAPPVEGWATAAQTLNYEIVTRISQRVPRRWIDSGGGDGDGDCGPGAGADNSQGEESAA